MFGVILSATFLVFLLITSAHFLHRGVGDMRDALRQTGMFLLNRAPVGLVDLFKDNDGNGSKTWIQYGSVWLVVSAIGGFLASWHHYDPTALDSLASIGWSWDDGSAMKTFNQTTLYAAVFSILLGGCLMAHSRANGGRLASEANAAMMGFAWFGITLVSLMLPIFIDVGSFETSLFGMIYAALIASILVNLLITNASTSDSTSVSSWFLIMGLISMVFAFVIRFVAELAGSTQIVWMANAILNGWVPLALIFAVGYHVIPATTGRPIWSGSLTKASMLLLFVTVSPFFLSKSADSTLIQSVAAILVTMGLFPILAASTNLLATTRGDAGSIFQEPGALAIAAGALLLPIFAVLAFFTGLNVMVGDASLELVASTVNMGYLYTIGGLFSLGVIFSLYPAASGNKLAGRSASMATWFVIVGGLFSTIVSLMGNWMFIEISPLVEDATYENVSGFSLTASVGFYLVTIGMLMTTGIVAKTAFSRTPYTFVVAGQTDVSVYHLTQGETSIRKLLSRGVGLDSNLVIGASEEEEGGSTVIAVATELHNDEVTEFPVHFEPELVELTKWLAGRGTTARQFFEWADVDNSGSMDLFEFSNALRVAEIADLPPWDIEKLVHAMDLNGDGRIDLPEIDIHLMGIRNALDIEFIEYVEEETATESGDSKEAISDLEEQVEESEEHPESEDADEVEHVEGNVEDKADETAADYSISDLNKMKKAELVELATSLEIDTSGTKKDLVERINSNG